VELTPCPGRTRAGEACPRAAGSTGFCAHHDPAAAAERGRKGGEAKAAAGRAARAALAEQLAVETVADLRAALLEALRMATVAGDHNAMMRAVAVGADLVKTGDHERQIAELREMVAARFPGARMGRDA
jgi:hypothetical protein